ncbi:hypothetical protein [Roseicyclus persicicus]|uniref:Uncharacterized protein n=1 Tax=Roseicyclus persicicus TaxID=2650661 RepID=A0A7X6H0S2_9RHOB|nr:hypothetical protein [Roseibacterium persicicum]NKX45873.1 hypothetical protein [Roseibacterium persicicum]
MIWTFLLGAAAGFAVPYVEPQVKRAAEQMAQARIEVEDSEFDLVTLVLLLLVAAALSGGGNAFALLAGALLGVFGKRIVAAIQGRGGDA